MRDWIRCERPFGWTLILDIANVRYEWRGLVYTKRSNAIFERFKTVLLAIAHVMILSAFYMCYTSVIQIYLTIDRPALSEESPPYARLVSSPPEF